MAGCRHILECRLRLVARRKMPEFMATRQAVVLGARFGGLAVVTWLRRVYSPGPLEIVVIDRWAFNVPVWCTP